MTNKHTPGPWEADYDLSRTEDDITVTPIFAADGCEIAWVITASAHGTTGGARNTTADEDRVQGEANARLIAAAPTLFAALADLLRFASPGGLRGEPDKWIEEAKCICDTARAALAAAEGGDA